MGYIGVQPASVPLSVNDVPDLPATKITSGTFPALNGSNLTNLDAADLTGNLPAISGASLTGISAGVSVIDSWKVTSQWTSSGNYHVASNWSRVSSGHGFGTVVGTGMTESSGYFTYPSTGYYLITFQAYGYYNQSSNYIGVHIYSTQNDSSYGITNQGYTHCTGSGQHSGAFSNMIFRVANVSNHKTIFKCESGANIDWKADSSAFRVGANFMKLGDL